jgi:hypothetical protein
MGNDEVPFSGDRIPAAAIAKIKAGKRVAVDVTYKRNGGPVEVASGVLKVVP